MGMFFFKIFHFDIITTVSEYVLWLPHSHFKGVVVREGQ